MSGHKEKEQWKDAEIDLKRDGKRHFGRRKAPFYKVCHRIRRRSNADVEVMTGMPVAVDAFRYGAIPKVTAYLLTWVGIAVVLIPDTLTRTITRIFRRAGRKAQYTAQKQPQI